MDLQQVGGSDLDAALDIVEGSGDAAGEHREVSPEDGEEVRRLLALHHAHLFMRRVDRILARIFSS